MGDIWERQPVNFVVFRSLRLPLNIFRSNLYQSLRGSRMMQIGSENIKKSRSLPPKADKSYPSIRFIVLQFSSWTVLTNYTLESLQDEYEQLPATHHKKLPSVHTLPGM